mmetsp:Transcript_35611/g.84315  ORF Transcript_35611/g.84315 Transcript_35611/m.84315 type:complete len:240 (-) Transcript_35611:520-1239(-)
MCGFTPEITVGPTKFPLGYPGTETPRPSRRRVAPSSTADWIRASTRSFACLEMRGPISAPCSVPPLTVSAFAFSTREESIAFESPTKTAALRAMQRWPAAPNAAPTSAFTAWVGRASGITTPQFLAAMLHWHLFPPADPRFQMCSPAWLDPTKEIDWISGESQMKLTVSFAPWITLTTPGGMPASVANSTSRIPAPGTFSEGLNIMVLPVAVARGNIQRGIIAGKLKGAIPAVTPIGWR